MAFNHVPVSIGNEAASTRDKDALAFPKITAEPVMRSTMRSITKKVRRVMSRAVWSVGRQYIITAILTAIVERKVKQALEYTSERFAHGSAPRHFDPHRHKSIAEEAAHVDEQRVAQVSPGISHLGREKWSGHGGRAPRKVEVEWNATTSCDCVTS